MAGTWCVRPPQLFAMLLPIAVLSFVGCAAFHIDPGEAVYPNGGGSLEKTDHKGHFLHDIVYVDYYNGTSDSGIVLSSKRYLADGTFEELWYNSNASQNKPQSGTKGEYSFLPETLTMKRLVRAFYMRDGSWGGIRRGETHTWTSREYFAEKDRGDVFIRTGKSWVGVRIEDRRWSRLPGGRIESTSTTTYEIAPGKNGYHRRSVTIATPGLGASFLTWISEETADAIILPEGSKFSKGESVRIQLTNNYTSWQGWEGNELGVGKLGPIHEGRLDKDYQWTAVRFTNMGGYIIETPGK